MNGGSVLDILFWFIMLALYAYIYRELEVWRILKDIEKYLQLYRSIRDKAVSTTLNTFKQVAAKSKSKLDIKDLEGRVRNLIEYVLIEPVNLDPYGIVSKLKHIMLTGESVATQEVKRLLPNADRVDIENLKDLIEASRYLNLIFKSVDHIYRLGRKFKSIWLLYQLQALLPFLTEEVRALESSLEAFTNGFPIGDSAGPLTAAKLINKYSKMPIIREIAENTIATELLFENRKIVVIKAKGPSGVTGRLDDAILKVIEENPDIKMIITVDAALKFEGETTGMIAEGVGVAMGGIGVERFNIEKLATDRKIPLYAILIKMSEPEALAVMDKRIYDATERALAKIEQIIRERSNPGDTVLVVGVGNSIGVYP